MKDNLYKVLVKVVRRQVSPEDLEDLNQLGEYVLDQLFPILQSLAQEVVRGVVRAYIAELRERYNIFDLVQLRNQLLLTRKHPFINYGLQKIVDNEQLRNQLKALAIEATTLYSWLHATLLNQYSGFDDVIRLCDSEDYQNHSSNPLLLGLAAKLRHSSTALEYAKTIRMLNEIIKNQPTLFTDSQDRLIYMKTLI